MKRSLISAPPGDEHHGARNFLHYTLFCGKSLPIGEREVLNAGETVGAVLCYRRHRY